MNERYISREILENKKRWIDSKTIKNYKEIDKESFQINAHNKVNVTMLR